MHARALLQHSCSRRHGCRPLCWLHHYVNKQTLTNRRSRARVLLHQIVGSHDCELKFFEPMFSWKWATGCVGVNWQQAATTSPYPLFEVRDIEYTSKGIESLPDSWSVEVSAGCKTDSSECGVCMRAT